MLAGSLDTQSQYILDFICLLGIATGDIQGGFYSEHLEYGLVEPGFGRLILHPSMSTEFSVTSGPLFLNSIRQTEKSLQVTLFA